MSAALALTNVKAYGTATASLTGAAATTLHVFTITHPFGGAETHTATTNGSGAASITFVPTSMHGSYTVTVTTVVTSTIATATSST